MNIVLMYYMSLAILGLREAVSETRSSLTALLRLIIHRCYWHFSVTTQTAVNCVPRGTAGTKCTNPGRDFAAPGFTKRNIG